MMSSKEEKEVITHILFRLPAKSVLRFQSVCKLWSLITQEHDFIVEHAKNRENQGDPGIMCINSFNFSPPTLEYFTDGYHRHVKHSSLCPHDVSLMSNSCHGLVCTYGSSPKNTGVFLVNPTIDDVFLELPEERRTTIKYDKFIGLGYDSSLNEYKVVTLFSHHDKTLGCEFLTLGDAAWRKSGDILPFELTRYQTPVFVNGTIHWKIEPRKGEMGLKILCFNIINETFDTIIYPKCNPFDADIIEYDGSLCIYMHYANSCRSSLLVMTDYANCTWVVQHMVDLTPIKDQNGFANFGNREVNEIKCIGVHKGKVIFCKRNSMVYYYSIHTRMFEKYTKLHAGPDYPSVVASYSESLISASRTCRIKV